MHVPIPLQTVYAELVEQAAIHEIGREFPAYGGFTKKTVKGQRYVYWQGQVGNIRRQNLARHFPPSSAAANAAQPLPPQAGADRKSGVFLRLRGKSLRPPKPLGEGGLQGMGVRYAANSSPKEPCTRHPCTLNPRF